MKLIRWMATVLLMMVGGLVLADDFLPPEQAFKAMAEWSQSGNQINLTVHPQSGYYVYKESLKFSATPKETVVLGQAILPKGKIKFDPNFGKQLETYPEPFQIIVPLRQSPAGGLVVDFELQGCANKGICYPPMTLRFMLAAPGAMVDGQYEQENESAPENYGVRDLWAARDDVTTLAKIAQNISPMVLVSAFFILGLAMALTPCVLPMLPIMSSVVFGAKTATHQNVSKWRASLLAAIYVLGMALMYSLAGMATASLGANIQAWLQNTWVLVVFAIFLLGLAASLFGFYELRLPSSWHNKIDQIAGKQEGGSVLGAFFLGAISTLIASPCVTAPLAGVLAFIAQTGSVKLGGLLLFVMALGMGLPLMLVAIGARGLLPKAGAWMTWVQKIFGVLLVSLAVWVVSPVFVGGKANLQTHELSSGLVFTRVGSLTQLNELIADANASGHPVMIDFYADWCVTCKEMELLTFSNRDVVKALETYKVIQIDVTRNTAEDQVLLKRFSLFGPPAILFIDKNGVELTDKRVIGFMKAERFLERIN